jgi:hypothetical protein
MRPRLSELALAHKHRSNTPHRRQTGSPRIFLFRGVVLGRFFKYHTTCHMRRAAVNTARGRCAPNPTRKHPILTRPVWSEVKRYFKPTDEDVQRAKEEVGAIGSPADAICERCPLSQNSITLHVSCCRQANREKYVGPLRPLVRSEHVSLVKLARQVRCVSFALLRCWGGMA